MSALVLPSETGSPLTTVPGTLQQYASLADIPIELYSDIFAHLHSSGGGLQRDLVSPSLVCKDWRRLILPLIYRQIVVTIKHDLYQQPEAGSSNRDDSRQNAIGDTGLQKLWKLHEFLRLNRHIAAFVEHLVLEDSRDTLATHIHSYSDICQEDPGLLWHILAELPRLRILELGSLVLVDALKAPELMAKETEPGRTRDPINLDYLRVRFWEERLGLTLQGVPRLRGLLALFGNVKHLELHDDMPYSEPFRDHGPPLLPLPAYLRFSALEFRGASSQPSIMRTIIAESTVSELRFLDVDGIVEDQLEELELLLHEAYLNPEHLMLAIYEAPAMDESVNLDLSKKSRLQEITLRLPFYPTDDETSQDDDSRRIVQCASTILSRLCPPSVCPASLHKINVIIEGASALQVRSDELQNKFERLDAQLVSLCRLAVEVTVDIRDRYAGDVAEMVRRLRAELFPGLR